MGSSETKIQYETVDKTDPAAQEKGRQKAQEENAKLLKEMEKQLKQQKERDMAAALEDVRLQNQSDQNARDELKRRKAEREAENKNQEKYTREKLSCLKMKKQLLEYKFGQKLLMSTFKAEGLDVSDMDRVVVTLFGPTGSGKTSFIGTVERSLLGKEKQTAFEQGAGAEGTVILQEYLSSLNINLLDTRGFWNVDDELADECLKVMTGRTRAGQVMTRNVDNDELGEKNDYTARSMAKFRDRVHAVIFVVQAHDKRLKQGAYLERMKKIRDHFRFEGHSPVTIITCKDKIKNENDKELAFREASAATGSPMDRTFFISNYTKDNEEYSLDTEKTAVDVMDTVLYSAERFVKIQKLREEHHGSMSGPNANKAGLETVKQFFNRLQIKKKWKAGRVDDIVKQIEANEVKTVVSLKDCWEDIKKEVGMTIGIKNAVEEALKEV